MIKIALYRYKLLMDFCRKKNVIDRVSCVSQELEKPVGIEDEHNFMIH